ncbi:MAG TPA: hypothetical protein ENJ95_17295 [Bacteroidetes bacterium]|nr:hypothetical protein [Bacteroidota bacterium]
MKKKCTLLFLPLLLSVLVAGQKPSNIELVFKTNPLRLFNPNVPGIQAGAELTLNRRFAFSLEYGFPFMALTTEGLFDFYDQRSNWDYFIFTAEAKYLLPAKHCSRRHYWSAQYFVIPQSYTKGASRLLTNDGNIVSYSSSDVSKKEIGFSVNTGLETYFDKFFVDVFIGIGLKSIGIDHKLLNPSSGLLPVSNSELKPWQDEIDLRRGVFLRPYGVVGLKLGFGPI